MTYKLAVDKADRLCQTTAKFKVFRWLLYSKRQKLMDRHHIWPETFFVDDARKSSGRRSAYAVCELCGRDVEINRRGEIRGEAIDTDCDELLGDTSSA